MTTQQEHQLKRGLKNRHIQLIALGGGRHRTVFRYRANDPYGRPVGPAGVRHRRGYRFLYHASAWRNGGRGAGGGVVQPFRQPLLGPFAGFMSGWNYWVLYVLVSMAELTAVGIYIQYWWPEVPTAVGGDLLRGDQRHQPDARQSVWRAGVLVLDCQSGRHHQHDRLWLLSVI